MKKKLTQREKLIKFFAQKIIVTDAVNVWIDLDEWILIASALTGTRITKKLFLEVCPVRPERTSTGRLCLPIEMKRYSQLLKYGLNKLYIRMCL